MVIIIFYRQICIQIRSAIDYKGSNFYILLMLYFTRLWESGWQANRWGSSCWGFRVYHWSCKTSRLWTKGSWLCQESYEEAKKFQHDYRCYFHGSVTQHAMWIQLSIKVLEPNIREEWTTTVSLCHLLLYCDYHLVIWAGKLVICIVIKIWKFTCFSLMA